MPIPEKFNVFKDGYITIEMRSIPDGHAEVKRNCIGTELNLVAMVMCAMAKQPELKDVLVKAVDFYRANPDVIDILKKK
jgi:hypothetical protein